MPQVLEKIKLGPLTSFGVGGPAERYLRLASAAELNSWLTAGQRPRWLLGSGTNVLISDEGLPGLTLHLQGGKITRHGQLVIAEAGAEWDAVVQLAVESGLWGIELMSGIPGTVGGAAAININAYGQSLVDRLDWVEAYDPGRGRLRKLKPRADDWDYKHSPFADGRLIVLRLGLGLKEEPTDELRYAKALEYARRHGFDPASLRQRRQIILGVRAEAGSLLNDSPAGRAKTCGSFFGNPIVRPEQIDRLLAHEESGLEKSQLLEMNRLHGGRIERVSGAHVLLAAGFKRGQAFGKVRLHPSNVLKLENWRGASAQEIYQTARLIQRTVAEKLKIKLEFEVRTLGHFRED